jgi:hypothetical protein
MEVEHRLFGVWTAGIQYVHPICPKGRPHGFRETLDKEHRGVQLFITNIKEIGCMCEGSYQAMSRGQASVLRQEGDCSVRSVHNGRWQRSCADLTKGADHVETMTQRSSTPTSKVPGRAPSRRSGIVPNSSVQPGVGSEEPSVRKVDRAPTGRSHSVGASDA